MGKKKKSRMVRASALSEGRRAAARAASLTPLSWACGRIERAGSPSSMVLVRDIDCIISRDILPERLANATIIAGDLEFRCLLKEDHPGRFVIIDQSNNGAYAPDLANRPNITQITIDIPSFLRDITGIRSWPGSVREFPYREIIKRHWPKFLHAYQDHIEHGSDTLSEERLRAIAAEAVLGTCLTDLLAPADLLELAVRKGTSWDDLLNFFGREETAKIREMLKRFPVPWGDMFDTIKGDTAVKAAIGMLVIGQHFQNPGEIMTLIDPRMHAYRNAEGWTWPKDKPFPAWLKHKVQEFEADLGNGFADLCSRLDVSNPDRTMEVLSKERCSNTIRTLSLLAALGDMLEGEKLSAKRAKYEDLAHGLRTGDLSSPVDDESFNHLKDVFLHAFDAYGLLSDFGAVVKSIKLKKLDQMKFSDFSSAFIDGGAYRIEYLISSLRKDWSTTPQLRINPEWVPRLREKISGSLAQLEQYASSQLDAFNVGFQKFIQRKYREIAGSQVLTTTDFIPQFIKDTLLHHKDEEPIFVILFDGMRFDLWRELFLPLFEDRYIIQREEVGLARLPTVTRYSRRAAFAGLPPSRFNVRTPESALLQEALKRIGSPGDIEDATDFHHISGITMAVRARNLKLTWLVIDCSDKLPHAVNYDLATTFDVISGLSDSVRAILNSMPEKAHVFILSDHGFGRCGTKSISLSGDQVSYRYAFLEQEPSSDIRSRSLCFKASEIEAAKSGYFLFPHIGSHFTQRGRRDRTPTYHHGGATLEELFVPLVHLVPARAAKPTIEIVVVTEDEYIVGVKGLILAELTLAGTPSEQVTLRSDVPGFKDRILNLISGQAKTVEISFTPDSEGDFSFTFEARKGRSVLGKCIKTITVLPEEGVERTGVDKLKQLFGDD